jgi:hypothetical protein
MLIRGFVKAVAELLGDRVPSYRRHPRRLGAMGLDLSRTEIQSLEQRLVLAAPMLGAELATYELNPGFTSLGRKGASLVIDGDLYIPGNNDRSPIVAKLDLATGRETTLVLEGHGSVSGLFRKDGQIYFVGFTTDADRSYDVTYWDQSGNATAIVDLGRTSYPDSVSHLGRAVLSIGRDVAGYADVGNVTLHELPAMSGFAMGASSITSDNRYIGAGGFDADGVTIGLVYEFNRVSGQYVILKADYKTSRGEDVQQMILHETATGIVGLAPYFNLATFANELAILRLDGGTLAELGTDYKGAVAVGDKFFVATQGAEGRVKVFNDEWNHEEYTSTQLFGASGIEFQAGSLAATEDGKLVVIGTRVSDGKVFVKTFDVPQDATLPQVDGSSIVVPELVAGGAGTISWAPVAGATGYELVFSQNGVVARTASVTTASYAVPASFRAGSYALTIRATAGETLGPLSSEVTVVVKPQAVVLSTLTGLPEVANSASVVRWQAVPDASSYSVIVRQVSAPTNAAPVFSGTTQTNSISLPTGLAANVYELTIVARSGVILSRETKATFTVKQGSVNAASITGFGSHPGAQTVTWQAVAGAAVAGMTRYEVQVTELGSSTPMVTRIVTTNAVSFTLARTGRYRLSLRVLGSPAATHGSWVAKNFVLVLPVVPVASIRLSQTIAGVATNVSFGRVAGAVKYDLWVYSVPTQQYVLKTSLTAISHRLAAGLSAGRYRVFVRGVDDAGRAAAWAWRDVAIVPLAQVTGVAVSGLGSATVAGSVAWRAVSGAVSYEVLISGPENRVVRRVTVSGVSLALPTGLAAGQYQVQVRAKNALSTGAWSAVRAFVVRLAPVQNLRVAAITVGEAGRVLWSRVAGAVDYEVTVRRAGAAGSGLGAVVHRGSSTALVYVLPKSFPVGEYVVLVRARGAAAGLASDFSQVAWSVRPLPAAVESYSSGVAAVANGSSVTVTVRDSKLKVLGTFSSLPDLGVFLMGLPAGMYPNVVRTGSVSQVVRFVKLHASPLVSVVGGRLTVASPVGSGLSSVVQTALLLVPNVNNGPLPPVLLKGRAVGYGLPSGFSAGRVYVRLMFADGSESDWAVVAV